MTETLQLLADLWAAVPEDDAHRYFACDVPSPFMLLAVPVKEEAKAILPSITHVDGTARLQTVTAQSHPRYHALLKAFGRRTGGPVLLNTSFNLRGEPIVCTPEEAWACFSRTRMDALVIGRYVVTKPEESA